MRVFAAIRSRGFFLNLEKAMVCVKTNQLADVSLEFDLSTINNEAYDWRQQCAIAFAHSLNPLNIARESHDSTTCLFLARFSSESCDG